MSRVFVVCMSGLSEFSEFGGLRGGPILAGRPNIDKMVLPSPDSLDSLKCYVFLRCDCLDFADSLDCTEDSQSNTHHTVEGSGGEILYGGGNLPMRGEIFLCPDKLCVRIRLR